MNTSEAIRARRSMRKFISGATVSDEQLHALLESAMMAPSACNTRPWEFVVVKNRDKLDAIRARHPYTKMLETAALAIVVCARPDVQTGIAKDYFPQDCGAATMCILLEAVEQGLGACWCGVHPKVERQQEIAEVLDIEDGVIPFCIIAVGVPDATPPQRGFYEAGKVRIVE